jgi:hypothetical protein
MDFYLYNTDPRAILTLVLPEQARRWSGDSEILKGVDSPLMDTSIFSRFYDKYRVIAISSGQPHGEYGQTVTLYTLREVREPNLATLTTTGVVPEHLMGEHIPFKPSEMTGEYQFVKLNDRVADRPRVIEKFFFPYQEVYKPSRFVDLGDSLTVIRYLSSVLHQLSVFEMVLLETGIYVELVATITDSNKPPFCIDS